MAESLGQLWINLGVKSTVGKDLAGVKGQLSAVNAVAGGTTGVVNTVGGALRTMTTAAVVAGGAVGVGLVAGGVKAAGMFQDFEQAVANTASVLGVTGEAFGQAKKSISDVAKELGAKTVFSSKDAADAMYNLASAGYDVSKMGAKDLVPMLNLASGTQYGLAETTDIMASSLSQFGLGFQDMGRVADVYAKAIGVSQASMDKLGYSMNYVGPIAASMGISIEKTTAALSVLYNAGLKGEQAGTGLRSVLSDLVNPTDKAAAALKAMGINVEDVNPSTHELTDIIQLLADKGLNSAQAFQIFGQVGAPAILSLTSKAGDLKTLTKELQNAGGAAQTMADQQLDTLSGSLEALSGSIENVFISVGAALAPTIRSIAGYLDEAMPSIEGFVVGAVNAFIGFVTQLKPTANAIITVGKTILNALSDIFESITGSGASAASGAAALINSIFMRIADIVLWVTPIIKSGIITIVEIIKDLIPRLQPVWNNIKTIASGLIENLKNAFDGAVAVLTPIWNALKAKFEELKPIILSAISGAVAALGTAWGWLKAKWDELKPIITDAINRLKPVWDDFKKWLDDGIQKVKDFIKEVTPTWEEIKAKWNELKQIFSDSIDALQPVFDILKTQFDNAVQTFKDFYNNLGPTWENLKSSWDSVKTIWNDMKDEAAPAMKAFVDSLSGDDAKEASTNGATLASAINMITGAVSGLLKFAAEHPTITKMVIAIAALTVGFAALGAAALLVGAAVAAGVAAIPAILGGVGAAITSFAIAVGVGLAVALAAFAIYDIVSAARNMKAGLDNVWNTSKEAFATHIQNWKTGWQNLKDTLSTKAEEIKTVVRGFKESIDERFNALKTSIANFKTNWSTEWTNIKTAISTIASQIVTAVQTWYSNLKSNFNNVVNALVGLYNDFKTQLNNIYKFVQSAVSQIVSKFGEFPGKIKSALGDLYTTGYNWINSLKNGVTSAFSSLLTTAKGYYDDLMNIISKGKSASSSYASSSSAAYPKDSKGNYVPTDYAIGGIFTSAQVIRVGEAGPEAVLPLDKIPEVFRLNDLVEDAVNTRISPSKLARSANYNSYAGDIINIGPITVNNQSDVDYLMRQIEARQKAKGMQRGLLI